MRRRRTRMLAAAALAATACGGLGDYTPTQPGFEARFALDSARGQAVPVCMYYENGWCVTLAGGGLEFFAKDSVAVTLRYTYGDGRAPLLSEQRLTYYRRDSTHFEVYFERGTPYEYYRPGTFVGDSAATWQYEFKNASGQSIGTWALHYRKAP